MTQQPPSRGLSTTAEKSTYASVLEAVDCIRSRIDSEPKVGIILGSGLGLLAERICDPAVIPYEEIPHFPRSTVKGHSGRLLAGELSGTSVLVMQGRVHLYEGYSAEQITFPVRVMQLLGIETLIVTNAAGGVRPGFRAGDLMAITDQINLPGMAGQHPLRGPHEERFGPRFPDMVRAYDAELLDRLRNEARAQNISLQEGVYLMVAGPAFETPAEVRLARALGADAVGMSTAPEVVVARHGGLRVLGISLITNVAVDTLAKSSTTEDVHEQVLAAGSEAAPRLVALLEGVLRRLS
jgi:purine-nucleoside phosphorylase